MFEALAIEKLEQLKRSISGEDVKGFSFFPRFGICWHLFANTKEQEINSTFLCGVFAEMGLDEDYPVETKLYGNDITRTRQVNWYASNMYDQSTEYGQVRNQLIDDLILYFKNKL